MSALFFMAYGNEILRRLEALNIEEELAIIVADRQQELADAIRFQLSEGKDREGNWLPRYPDDIEFFNGNAAAVEAYTAWKESKSPNKDKPRDVMDFYIRGDFHSSIKAKVNKLQVDFFSYSHIAEDVARKTSYKAFGLNPDSATRFFNYMVHPKLIKNLSRKTGIGYR